jgi:hypothetical protein
MFPRRLKPLSLGLLRFAAVNRCATQKLSPKFPWRLKPLSLGLLRFAAVNRCATQKLNAGSHGGGN